MASDMTLPRCTCTRVFVKEWLFNAAIHSWVVIDWLLLQLRLRERDGRGAAGKLAASCCFWGLSGWGDIGRFAMIAITPKTPSNPRGGNTLQRLLAETLIKTWNATAAQDVGRKFQFKSWRGWGKQLFTSKVYLQVGVTKKRLGLRVTPPCQRLERPLTITHNITYNSYLFLIKRGSYFGSLSKLNSSSVTIYL
jgi:hypothetical protein